MQPSETAFDRVKSLLGKMDRSIDDARRRRLDDPEGEDDSPDGSAAADQASRSDTERDDQLIGGERDQAEQPAQPTRPTSKYGRARPLREVNNGNGPNWQTA